MAVDEPELGLSAGAPVLFEMRADQDRIEGDPLRGEDIEQQAESLQTPMFDL